MKRRIAVSAQRALPTTEWPWFGTMTTSEPGMRAATRRASATVVRVSSSPFRISAGTCGSGVKACGSGPYGQPRQVPMRSLRASTPRLKGPRRASGTAAAAASRAASRSAGDAAAAHGSRVSRQLVATKRAIDSSAGSKRSLGDGRTRRSSGAASPASAAFTAPGRRTRLIGSRSPVTMRSSSAVGCSGPPKLAA